MLFDAQTTLEFKYKNTFRIAGIFKNDDGSTLDTTGYELSATIRNPKDVKVCNVVINKLGNGLLEFRLPAGKVLPIGTFYMDVLTVVTINGEVIERNTDIVEIIVKRTVTHA